MDWDLSSNTFKLSNRWKEMLGYAETELADVFQSWSNQIHPDDLENVSQ